MQVLREFPYLKIYWDEECRAIVLQWQGGYPGRNLREGLLAGVEELKKYLPRGRWIGDTSEIGVIGLEDQEWIDKQWFPLFLATGVKSMAVVQPKSAISKMSVKSIMSKVPGTQLTVFNCASLEEARDWIKKQK